jgi:hypothetical protein
MPRKFSNKKLGESALHHLYDVMNSTLDKRYRYRAAVKLLEYTSRPKYQVYRRAAETEAGVVPKRKTGRVQIKNADHKPKKPKKGTKKIIADQESKTAGKGTQWDALL